MVKTLLYLLSEGLVLLCVGLIPKSRKQSCTHHEDVFLEEFITNMWLRPLCASFKVYIFREGVQMCGVLMYIQLVGVGEIP